MAEVIKKLDHICFLEITTPKFFCSTGGGNGKHGCPRPLGIIKPVYQVDMPRITAAATKDYHRQQRIRRRCKSARLFISNMDPLHIRASSNGIVQLIQEITPNFI